jgi:hypothetical protein
MKIITILFLLAGSLFCLPARAQQAEQFRAQIAEIQKAMDDPNISAEDKAALQEVINQVQATINDLEQNAVTIQNDTQVQDSGNYMNTETPQAAEEPSEEYEQQAAPADGRALKAYN